MMKATSSCANNADLKSQKVLGDRLRRERDTIAAMVRIYCADHHGDPHPHAKGHPGSELCAECQGLMDYAEVRLQRCRFGEEKPTCANCPVHCYQKDRREQVRVVMRYAGPRMVYKHPVMSLRHWLDGFRKAPGSL